MISEIHTAHTAAIAARIAMLVRARGQLTTLGEVSRMVRLAPLRIAEIVGASSILRLEGDYSHPDRLRITCDPDAAQSGHEG